VSASPSSALTSERLVELVVLSEQLALLSAALA
jgi:hypothetical protein